MIRTISRRNQADLSPPSEELLAAVMTVASTDDIKRLFLELQRKNVAFAQPLETRPCGARNFIIKDPDGNLLLFAGPAK